MDDQESERREVWAVRVADRLVDGTLTAIERLPVPDQHSALRAIAKRALWHIPNAATEAQRLAQEMAVESLKQPHPRDDPPGRD